MSKTYKGLEIMQMISKGQIADRTRFNFENNNLDGVVEYYNGTLYWIIFDEKCNETGKKNLFEMFNIQSTMVADFRLIEDETIEIENVNAYKLMETPYMASCLRGNQFDTFAELLKQSELELVEKINKLIDKVNQLNKEIKSIKEK